MPCALALVAAVGMAAAREPATYHVAVNGRDAATGSDAAPFRTFARAWDMALSGDTIVVADGTYADASPPPGKGGLASAPITIRAANAGGATLDRLRLRGNSYLTFVGFRIDGATTAVGIGSNGPGRRSHHLVFQQIGFSCVTDTLNDDGCFTLHDGTHDVLLEDSWGWGGGRYTVLCYGGPGGKPHNLTCDRNTFRRVVLRQGPTKSSPRAPQASLALYYAADNLVENVVAIDGKASSDSSNSAFYITAHEPPPTSSGNRYFGVLALDNLGAGFWLDCPRATCSGVEVRGSVFWGASENAVSLGGSRCDGTIVDGNTMGAAKRHGLESYMCQGGTLTNNAFYRNGGFGARQSPSAGEAPAAHHNGYFGNAAGARFRIAPGAGDLGSDPRLVHVTRIERDSPYRNAGSSGAIGASLVHQYESGVRTGKPLWPWPHEERLRREMCASNTQGFCASGKSFTRYVWEALGRPAPATFDE